LKAGNQNPRKLILLLSARFTEHIAGLPRLSVHSAPVIADKAHSPKMGQKLNELALQSLISGLLCALLLPYLMELAFPPQRERFSKPDPVEKL
jgi:hypothetical protein